MTGERGAVAVMVAFLSIVLCILLAFILDFGMAYSAKRQAQTAADAAVLAAGKVYVGQPGACSTLMASPALLNAAEAQADSLRRENLPQTAGDDARFNLALSCSTGKLTLDYSVAVDSPIGLGRIVYRSDHVTVDRTAQVTLGASTMVGGCSVCILGNVDAGNADLSVTGGDIWVNGTVNTGPGSEWDATNSITINGSVSGLRSGNTTPPWQPGPDITDPYATLSLPLPTGALVAKTDPCTQGPGVYGSVNLPNGPCTLPPGAYIITGLWAAKNNTSLTTTGATLYVKKPGMLDFKNGELATFKAPASPPQSGWPSGFAIIYDRDNTNNLELQGNGNTQIIGTVYVPASTISFNGNSCFTTSGGPIVAGGMSANGTKGCVKLENASNVGGTWVTGGEEMTR